MKKIVSIILLLFTFSAQGQRHLDVSSGYSFINPVDWNRTISAYNFARPWLDEKQPELHSAFSAGLNYSGVISKGLFLSPSLSHQMFKSKAENGNSKADIRFRWMSAELDLDIYPLEFGLDSVGFKIRPFVRVGGGASALLPRVLINDSLSIARGEVYDPIIWTYQFTAGLGCRFSISPTIDITPVFSTSYFPSIDLENFRYALHGTEYPDLTDITSVFRWQFTVALSIRLGSKEVLTD
jgi:hypothetical protein